MILCDKCLLIIVKMEGLFYYNAWGISCGKPVPGIILYILDSDMWTCLPCDPQIEDKG